MKLLISLYTLIISYSIAMNSNSNSLFEKSQSVLEVTFSSFFEDDTISIHWDTCKISDNRIISTNLIDGVTNFQFSIFKSKEGYSVSVINSSNIICKCDEKEIFAFNIVLNGTNKTYQINPQNGKFVIFLKKGENLTFKQYHERPVFD